MTVYETEQQVIELFRQLSPNEQYAVLCYIRTGNNALSAIAHSSPRLYVFLEIAFPECLQDLHLGRRVGVAVPVEKTEIGKHGFSRDSEDTG